MHQVKNVNEFVEHLHEVFRLFGPIHAKSMFGGYGIYHQDVMFGLVADNTLYLKTDVESESYFSAVGSLPFEYTKNGVPMKMSYFSAPAEVFDAPETAKFWSCRAYEAALRSKNKTVKRSQ